MVCLGGKIECGGACVDQHSLQALEHLPVFEWLVNQCGTPDAKAVALVLGQRLRGDDERRNVCEPWIKLRSSFIDHSGCSVPL